MVAPTNSPIAWGTDATWTSGSRIGDAVAITPPSGVAEQGVVASLPVRSEYVNACLANFYSWLEFLRTESDLGRFGDGSDGPATITGGTTTLTRDTYYSDCTVEATGRIALNGFRLFVRDTLTIESGGYVHANGADGDDGTGSGGAGGAGAPAGSVLGGADGGAGGSVGVGTAGTAAATSLGGSGGLGGSGSDGATGGAGGAASLPAASLGGYRHSQAALGALYGASYTQFRGGGGGGGGGGGTSGGGGGGGGGAGVASVHARIADLSGVGAIRAAGGAGGDAYTGPDAAGNGSGAGGGGGVVYLVSRQRRGTGTITAPGGAGGTPFGTGTAGAAGSAGLVFEFTA